MRDVAGLERIDGPFAFAWTDAALSAEALSDVRGLFERPQAWVRHADHFYRCHIAEVDGQLPAAGLQALRRSVAAALDLDLAGPVRVTAQRMDVGDGADRHTDRPLVGYEAARLAVQLDQDVGGHFRTFDGTRVWVDRAPTPNGAVAFELSTAAHHEITPCTGARRTVVFHFWHAANPIDAREALDVLLGDVRFAHLPRALHPHMTHAEATTPDEVSHRAGMVAALLQRWGLEVPDIVRGYCAMLDDHPLTANEALAEWLVRLHVRDFDRLAWERLVGTHDWPTAPWDRGDRWLARGPRCGRCAAPRREHDCRFCGP